MTAPVKTITLEFFRAGDVLPVRCGKVLVVDHLGNSEICWCAFGKELYSLESRFAQKQSSLKWNDLWAYLPEVKEVEDE